MAGQPVDLGVIRFPTKGKATEHFKEMLNRLDLGKTLVGQDSRELGALLLRHPEAPDKIGCGVQCFYVDMTDHGTRCFWVERVDGSKTEFSYPSCISGRAPTLEQEFAEACREAVRDDLREAKRAFFGQWADSSGTIECAITGDRIGFEEAHLDHAAPQTFQVLVKGFMVASGVKPSRDILSSPADNQTSTTFIDEEVKRRWRRYHYEMTKNNGLRVVKAKANLEAGGRHRIKKLAQPVFLQNPVAE